MPAGPREEREGWEQLVTSYLLGREPLALCVVPRGRAPRAHATDDETLRAFLEHHGLPYVVAATKADKLGRGRGERSAPGGLAQGLGRARVVVPA